MQSSQTLRFSPAARNTLGVSPGSSVRPHTSQFTTGVFVLIDLRVIGGSRAAARPATEGSSGATLGRICALCAFPLLSAGDQALTASASSRAASTTFCARWPGISS